MQRSVDPVLRWSRALVLGLVAFWSGVIAHVSAGGLMPGHVALAVLLALVVLTCARLLGRPASSLRIVLLLVAGQTFIHGALTASSGHRGDPTLRTAPTPLPLPPVTPSKGGTFADQVNATVPQTSTQLVMPAPVQHLVNDLTGPHAVMALAHVAAAVAIGLWLAQGERLLWALLALTLRSSLGLVEALVAVVVAAGGGLRRPVVRPVSWAAPPGAPSRVALAPRVTRRGPPALLAA